MRETEMTYELLKQAVAGDAVAVRTVTRLQPAGGRGDKVFPPTYATGDRVLKYATEDRRVDGLTVRTVLLDSVPSQANRMEEALHEAWESGALDFPVIAVDFRDEEGLAGLGRITTLHAPHRIADALLRDSVDESMRPFRETQAGKHYTEATVKDATAVYQYCPTALVFGVWDSTGPKGGLGSKFQRALVSEIVGYGVEHGVKTASRIDPAGIQANVKVFHRKDDPSDWTIREDEAQKKKDTPVEFSRKGSEGKGKPSAINHSNVAPSIDKFAGGVTLDYALHTAVLSLPALRRLRFGAGTDGAPFAPANRPAAELAARTALAALALAGLAYHRRQGYDLRSRSFLVPESAGAAVYELIGAEGGEPSRFTLTAEAAAKLLGVASKAAGAAGLAWEREPVKLRPSPKLADLIRRSRELAAAGDVEEG
jgi:CRISPR-associated protein Csb1